jgi:hypothetical protein
MKESLAALALVAAVALALIAIALAGCQSPPVSTNGTPNSTLTQAGFVAKRANTPEQVAVLNGLPPNTFVRQTANGKATYLYADPGACGCVHVGSQSAFQSVRGMQNIVYDMNRLEFGGGLDPDNIGDLSDWQPF